jgi:hypothetical protein
MEKQKRWLNFFLGVVVGLVGGLTLMAVLYFIGLL